jgi:hypothetical protein
MANRKTDILEKSGSGEPFNTENFFSRRYFPFWEELGYFPAYHGDYNIIFCNITLIPCINILAIPKNCYPVCQPEHILETMGDKNY